MIRINFKSIHGQPATLDIPHGKIMGNLTIHNTCVIAVVSGTHYAAPLYLPLEAWVEDEPCQS